MNTNQHMEERLWDFIDGHINETERITIQELMKENVAWKNKYDELLFISQSLHQSELDEPSMRFNTNVMDAIYKIQFSTESKEYINKKIIWFIGFFFITIITALLIYGFGQVEWNFSNSKNLKMPFDFPKIEYGFLSNNFFKQSFIIINVVLALMLFDNYLSGKKKLQH